jgi:GH25 family lysozyme M1 (1,4-beta-N-acetylmuramidase)
MSEIWQQWANENLAQPAEQPLNATDQGELYIRVLVQDRVLVIDFGKDLSWVGLTRATAEALIESMQKRLDELE